MIKCPMCAAISEEDARKCRKCQADLALLAEYVTHLRHGLGQAEKLTREGELGEAVWAYLAVLEVDPDNATARRQVGKVVTAVRQFDSTAPGRRWLADLRKESLWQRWFGEDGGLLPWALAALLFITLATVSYMYGVQVGSQLPKGMLSVEEQEKKEKDEAAAKAKNKAKPPVKPDDKGGNPLGAGK